MNLFQFIFGFTFKIPLKEYSFDFYILFWTQIFIYNILFFNFLFTSKITF